ncbi:hypothetical protein AB0C52_23540 [Streptomyces sp. NPDC048717]|uniref:hypothetical protein n=1 Tax=Streptomyces sp. NPDC048717 TaxID=3154928 RepID=UPI0034444004
MQHAYEESARDDVWLDDTVEHFEPVAPRPHPRPRPQVVALHGNWDKGLVLLQLVEAVRNAPQPPGPDTEAGIAATTDITAWKPDISPPRQALPPPLPPSSGAGLAGPSTPTPQGPS